METHDFDIAVIGAGMAGATAAAALGADHRVVLIEAEEAPGYHTTGRSAAMWEPNYGPPDIRRLTHLSHAFLDTPPPGFAQHKLLSQRRVVLLAQSHYLAELRQMQAEGTGLREASIAEIRLLVPALRPDYAAAALIGDAASDIDVSALHQGFLRQLRAAGGTLALRQRVGRIERYQGKWHVHTSTGDMFRVGTVVNAAGAWGDEVAQCAGIAPLGLVPCRRTAAIIDPQPYDVQAWPMLNGFSPDWYVRPEARTRLMVSLAEETPMHPHDVRPDELDVATAIDRMQQALDIEVRRVERSWAGLRTFTPDGSLAIGWDRSASGFFWCVGQGGYGIQTAPAVGRLVADLIVGRDPGAAADIVPAIDPARFS